MEIKGANTSEESKKAIPTKFICAINEKELDKVELAFFKRSQPTYILSDK